MSNAIANEHIRHQDLLAFAIAKVNLPAAKVTEYRGRVNSVRDRLAAKIDEDPTYAVVRSLHSGSVAKGTALRTINDFDLAVYLRADAVPASDSDLGPWLIDRLKEARPQLDDDQFSPQDHCVTITYRDGTKVDVVPVLDAGDGTGDGYLVRKDTGERVLTNIPKHLEFINERKRRLPQHYRQVIRLVKYWVRLQKMANSDFRCKSFVVELLCAHLLDRGVDMTDYTEALAGFFSYVVESGLREVVVFDDYYKTSAVPADARSVITIMDPVNPANNVTSSYTEAERALLVGAAHEALDAIDYATYAPQKGEAISGWRDVFGSSFSV
jgi:tRNA nucleotidyltransferase (CCA-adding enzyme)